MTLLGRSGEYHTYPPLESAVIAGGAAGDLTVTGIKTSDTLKLVQRVDAAGASLLLQPLILLTILVERIQLECYFYLCGIVQSQDYEYSFTTSGFWS